MTRTGPINLMSFFQRRLLPTVMAVVMSATGMVGALAPINAVAKSHGEKRSEQRGHIARDLDDELKAPKVKKSRWSKDVGGVHTVQLLVKSDGADAQMTDLRAEVLRLGGQVQVVHPSFKTLTVVLPATRVDKLAKHADVKSISPNRDTQGSASTVETIVGANAAPVRTYSNATTYSGFDGSGVGIAILDSGVMKAHKNLADAGGVSRVKRSVTMLNTALLDWSNPWGPNSSLQPGSAALAAYEAQIAADTVVNQDPYGHGTHVASVAAGNSVAVFQQPRRHHRHRAGRQHLRRQGARLDTGHRPRSAMRSKAFNWVIYHAKELNIRVLNISLAAQSVHGYDLADRPCCASRCACATAAWASRWWWPRGNFGPEPERQPEELRHHQRAGQRPVRDHGGLGQLPRVP